MNTETSKVSSRDKAIARQFLNCCYDDALRMPNKADMQRLVDLEWVERLPNGAYAEKAVLRSLDLY
jgi:hypothetical protein